MAHCITLRADEASSRPLRELARLASRFEDQPTTAASAYPPHVTLGYYDDAGLDEAVAAADRIFAAARPITLRFDRLNCLETDISPCVLRAEPAESAELHALHRALHTVIDPARCARRFRPGIWVPFGALALRVAARCRDGALAFAKAFDTPFAVTYDVGDVIETDPVRLRQAWLLQR